MHYFVDGYNLLFRVTTEKMPLQKKREILLSILASFHLNLTVVFDSDQIKHGLHDRSHWQDLEIVYTEKGQSADAYILQEIGLSNAPQRETVITSDKQLATHCNHRGAKTQTIEAFLEKMAKRKAKMSSRPSPTFKDSDREIARLLNIFESRLKDTTTMD